MIPNARRFLSAIVFASLSSLAGCRTVDYGFVDYERLFHTAWSHPDIMVRYACREQLRRDVDECARELCPYLQDKEQIRSDLAAYICRRASDAQVRTLVIKYYVDKMRDRKYDPLLYNGWFEGRGLQRALCEGDSGKIGHLRPSVFFLRAFGAEVVDFVTPCLTNEQAEVRCSAAVILKEIREDQAQAKGIKGGPEENKK